MKLSFKLAWLTFALVGIFILLMLAYGNFSSLIVWHLLIFGALVFWAENLTIQTRTDNWISVSFGMILAAIFVLGPTGAAIVSWGTALIFHDIRTRTTPIKWIFNGTQYAISAFIAGSVYASAGGTALHDTVNMFGASGNVFEGFILPAVLCVFVFFLINSAIVDLALLVINQTNFIDTFVHDLKTLLPNYFATIPVSLSLAYAFISAGVAGLALVFIPFLIIRQMFLTYVQANQNVAEIVKTLISTIEAKDTYTKQHSERVAEYSKLIGSQLRMPESRLVTLEKAAYLHDIGKIAVKRSILNKPQRLTDQEMMLMKRHPVVGYKLVKNIKLLEDALDPILKHHECIGGGGYPIGTKEIPIMARIIAIADAYDAMTSLRPYRRPMSHDQAVAELRLGAGRQFDKELVQLFEQGMARDAVPRKNKVTDIQAQFEFAN